MHLVFSSSPVGSSLLPEGEWFGRPCRGRCSVVAKAALVVGLLVSAQPGHPLCRMLYLPTPTPAIRQVLCMCMHVCTCAVAPGR